MRFMIIDTHIHLVSPDREKFPLTGFTHPGADWIENAPSARSFLPMMQKAGVERGLLVQPHGAYGTDNSYICSVTETHKRLVPVAIIDPFHPKVISNLNTLSRDSVVGLRLFSIPTPEESWIASNMISPLWDAANELRMTIGICVLPEELPEVKKCAETHTDHLIVLDHCGFAPLHQIENPVTRQLIGLKKYPNVILKVTTLNIDSWVTAGRKLRDLFPMLARSFGSSRLVWGSDYAQTYNRSYKQLVELGVEATDSLGAEASGPIGGNAREIWNLAD